MQIILLEKIINLGNLGDVVKVKDGYARNYLIPSKKAKRATPAVLAEFESRRAELERIAAETLAAAQARAEQINGLRVELVRKAGVDGRLFGSVGNLDIVEALDGHGHKVERSAVRLPGGPLKTIGENEIGIALHTDVIATITVAIVAET